MHHPHSSPRCRAARRQDQLAGSSTEIVGPAKSDITFLDTFRSPGRGNVSLWTPGPVLGPANARFNDYVGTVAADDAEAVKDQPSLYEIAGIDRDRYTILAVDLRVDGPVTATVYAIDRVEQGIARHAEIAELSESLGEIPVVPFDIPEVNVEDLIRHAFRRISVRLVTQHFRDHALVVIEPRAIEDVDAQAWNS